MTRPIKSREIRAQRKDKELFKHFGWGTELQDEDQAEPIDPDEFDAHEPDTRRQIGPLDCAAI